MKKVDIVIAVLGAVALLATVAGVLLFDDGTQNYQFNEASMSVDTDPEAVEGGEARFTWPTPQNATGAAFDVEVLCNGGNPIGPGMVSATVELIGPDNSTSTESQEFDVSAQTGCDQALGTISVNLTWAEVPDGFRGTEDDLDDRAMAWTQDIELVVTVEGPNEPGAVLPTQSLQFGAVASGSITAYEAQATVPDSRIA